MNVIKRNNMKWLVAVVILLAATFLFIWRLLPFSTDEMKRSAVMIEHRYYYVLKNNGSPLLYFNGISDDSLMVRPSLSKKELVEYSAGCWVNSLPLIPSCNGRIVTAIEYGDSITDKNVALNKIVENELANHENQLAHIIHAQREIKYYIDTHGVNDKGYKAVARYRETLRKERKRIQELSDVFKNAAKVKKLSVEKKELFFAGYHDIDNNLIRKECRIISSHKQNDAALLQVKDSITPDGVVPVSLNHPLPLFRTGADGCDTVFVAGKTYITNNDMHKCDIEIIPECLNYDSIGSFPKIKISDGSPVFTRSGLFIGIINKGMLIRKYKIRKNL